MTRAMWFYALFGMFVFGCLFAAIPVDITLVRHGQESISRWHLLTGLRYPLWFPVLIVAVVLLPIGGFMGHYWSPRNLDFWETAKMWAVPLVLAPVVLFVGLLLGRWLVAQTL